eukprot:gene37839-51084_t
MFNLFKRRAEPAATAQAEEQLLIVPVPSLVSSLLALETEKGSPLTESEVLEATDKAPSIAMPAHALAAVAVGRGYDDIDPENAWADWQTLKPFSVPRATPYPAPDAPADGTVAPAAEPGIPPQTLALGILATLAVLYTLSTAAEIIIPLLLAIMMKLVLQPVMRVLSGRLGLPLGLSALLLIFALFGVLGAVGLAVVVPASGWVAKAPAALVLLQDQLSLLHAPLAALSYALQQATHLAEPGATIAHQLGDAVIADAARHARLAGATHVIADHMEALGQAFRNCRPDLGGIRVAMHQHEGLATGCRAALVFTCHGVFQSLRDLRLCPCV